MLSRRVRPLTKFVAFWTAVVALVLFNHRSSSHKTYAWTVVRYKSSSATLPESRGICPGLEGSSKPALIVARVSSEDSTWLESLRDKYHLCIYTADAAADENSSHLQVPANRGHEAMAYLTFLIDNYDTVPDAGAVFIHGSRFAWHNDHLQYDNKALLASLNVSAALAPTGYHNMRCDWSAGTCWASESPPQRSFETYARAKLEPWNRRAASDAALPYAFSSLFAGHHDVKALRAQSAPSDTGSGTVLLGRSDAIRSQCCAQFVAARDQIRQHSREEYIAIRQWLLDGDYGDTTQGRRNSFSKNRADAAPSDDRIAGRILSYTWHVLFMRSKAMSYGEINLEQLNRLACPRADECYCRLYGRCELPSCSDPGRCRGQYRLPFDYRLPDDWAARHS